MQQMNLAPVFAVGRHALSFAMGAIACASVLHVFSAGDAANLTGAVNQIATGLSSVFAGGATIVSILTATYAAYQMTTKGQINAVAANPNVAAITVTTQALASAIPSDKVASQ